MEPWEATYKHQVNRLKLRAMYYVYATLRKKDPSEIDSGQFANEWDEKIFKKTVSSLLEKYQSE